MWMFQYTEMIMFEEMEVIEMLIILAWSWYNVHMCEITLYQINTYKYVN